MRACVKFSFVCGGVNPGVQDRQAIGLQQRSKEAEHTSRIRDRKSKASMQVQPITSQVEASGIQHAVQTEDRETGEEEERQHAISTESTETESTGAES